MKLIIGGYAQGKLNYVLQNNQLDNYIVLDGMWDEISDNISDNTSTCSDEINEKTVIDPKKNINGKMIIINHFNNWIKKRMRKERCMENVCLEEGLPEREIIAFIEKYPECIIISDEIGNGIVPIDGFEREYRERTGRILIELASRAEEVVRVICGISQKIK